MGFTDYFDGKYADDIAKNAMTNALNTLLDEEASDATTDLREVFASGTIIPNTYKQQLKYASEEGEIIEITLLERINIWINVLRTRINDLMGKFPKLDISSQIQNTHSVIEKLLTNIKQITPESHLTRSLATHR